MSTQHNITLLIHGGAGAIQDTETYRESMTAIIEHGKILLLEGKSALDTVAACVMLLENDARYNAGRGSVLNDQGKVEMDAGIMDGSTMRAGAVTGIRNVKNPIGLARNVMEHTEHVLLAGDGALQFARTEGVEIEADEYFITPLRQAQLKTAREKAALTLDHIEPPSKLGTVGAVALDMNGNIAAATSTGGLTNKKFGRVGDTPIIGAGVYAENETCGVSATGIGEQILRTSLAKTIADIIRHKHVSAEQAAKEGLDFFVSKVGGQGGVIVIDKNGGTAIAHSTPGMLAGGYDTLQGVFLVF